MNYTSFHKTLLENNRITIPFRIAKRFGLQKGDIFRITVTQKGVINLTPQKVSDKGNHHACCSETTTHNKSRRKHFHISRVGNLSGNKMEPVKEPQNTPKMGIEESVAKAQDQIKELEKYINEKEELATKWGANVDIPEVPKGQATLDELKTATKLLEKSNALLEKLPATGKPKKAKKEPAYRRGPYKKKAKVAVK